MLEHVYINRRQFCLKNHNELFHRTYAITIVFHVDYGIFTFVFLRSGCVTFVNRAFMYLCNVISVNCPFRQYSYVQLLVVVQYRLSAGNRFERGLVRIEYFGVQ